MNRKHDQPVPGRVALLATLLFGCGSPAEPASTLDDHPVAFARALCAAVFRCCPAPLDGWQPLRRWVGEAADQTFCEDAVAQALTDRLPHVKESVGAGRMAYSESATRTCLGALAEVKCEDFLWSDQLPRNGCWSLAGKVPTGGACVENLECGEGGCSLANGGVGSCAPLPGAGERCGGSCRRGLTCFRGTCVQPGDKLSGSRCGDGVECRSRQCSPDGNDFTCFPVQACGLSR